MAYPRIDVVVEELCMIKPPVATPTHTLFLHSLEQQLFFPVEILFSYRVESPESTKNIARSVREAVREALLPYYFIAGRIRLTEDGRRVELDCNGAGVLFAAATCSGTLKDAGNLRVPTPEARKFFAYAPDLPTEFADVPLVAVQVTRFSCGGFIVSFLANHLMFDGVSGAEFFDSIAQATRGEKLTIQPNPDRSSLRCRDPPKPTFDHPELVAMPGVPAKVMFNPAHYHPSKSLDPNFVFKIFSFTPAMLETLKKRALGKDALISRCTSFEALAAHVWQARTKAVHLDDDFSTTTKKKAKFFIVMNIRNKVKDLPASFTGNALLAVPTIDATINEVCTGSLSFCVKKIQEAISLGTEEHFRSTLDWCELNHGNIDLPGGLIATPWSKLWFHNIDFGFGKPEYVAPGVNDRHDFVIILSNCKGDGGQDVFICIHSKKLEKLEEFLRVDG